jgi:thiol-disulfide isomerase/thioredoxin
MKSVNFWVGLALAAAVVGVFVWVKPGEKKLAEAHLVPMSTSAAGSDHDITLANLQGRVVLLNFWGTWCPPCRMEFPHIVELYKKWGRKGVEFLPVSCSGGGEDLKSLRDQTAAFLKQEKADLPMYFDPSGATRRAVSEAVGFSGYPTTLVIDATGKIRATWVGYMTGREIEMDQMIAELVHERDTPAASKSMAAK